MRITHWTLLRRELPVTLRWGLILWNRFWWHVGHEFDQFLLGLSASPAWYFVTLTGGVGLLMAVTLFIARDPLRGNAPLSLVRPTLPSGSLKPHLNRDPDIDSRLVVWARGENDPQFRFDHHQDMAMASFSDGPPIRRAPRMEEPLPGGTPDLKWDLSWLHQRDEMQPIAEAETGPIRTQLLTLMARRSVESQERDGWGRVRVPIGDQSASHRPYVEGRESIASPMPPILSGLGRLDEPLGVPSSAEIAMNVELESPQQVEANHVQKARLVVRNDGSHDLRSVEVRESVASLETVVGAEPEAAVSAGDLYRVAGPLSPGRSKDFELDWIASDEGRRIHQARVVASGIVSTSTMITAASELSPAITETPIAPSAPKTPIVVAEPGKPAIYCRSEFPKRVRQHEVLQVDIMVRNSGTTPLRNVKIKAEIPQGLKHKGGSSIEQDVGNLGVGEVRRAVLRMVGEGLGKSKSKVWAAAEGDQVIAMTQVDVEILPRPVLKTKPIKSREPAASSLPKKAPARAESSKPEPVRPDDSIWETPPAESAPATESPSAPTSPDSRLSS